MIDRARGSSIELECRAGMGWERSTKGHDGGTKPRYDIVPRLQTAKVSIGQVHKLRIVPPSSRVHIEHTVSVSVRLSLCKCGRSGDGCRRARGCCQKREPWDDWQGLQLYALPRSHDQMEGHVDTRSSEAELTWCEYDPLPEHNVRSSAMRLVYRKVLSTSRQACHESPWRHSL